jgi:hypothetical protein
MTGSFFNPGPFAGYLCAILPVAVSIYSKSSNNSWFEDLNFKRFDCLIVRMFDRLKTSIKQSKTIELFFERSNQLFSNFQTSNSEASNNQTPKSSNILNGIALIAIIAIVLVLPASRSRAAWLGALAGCSFVFQTIIRQKTHQTSEASNIQTYFFKPFKQLNLLQKRGLLVVGILISVLALVGIYKFKQGSADGRLLIWKVSAEMIKDKPIFGHGADKFAADYMNYQAAYFKPNPDLPEAMQADNVTYAYNELLKLTVEKGLIGLLVALGVIGGLFFGETKKSERGRRQKLSLHLINPIVLAARGGLLSVIVFALFSYPSDILPIKILFVLFAAIVATHQAPIKLFQLPTQRAAFAGKVVLYSTLAVVIITVYPASRYLTRQYQAYKSWKDASDIYNLEAYPECLDDFELAYPLLKTNGVFLVQYGKALEITEKYESSVAILNQAKGYLNNTILYTCLGNNYKALGRNSEAEQAYLHAWHMAPARFYPLYLLAKLYDETGQHEKATAMAKEVMEKEVKVESTAIKEIQEEMRKIIEQGDVGTQNESNKTDNNITQFIWKQKREPIAP